MYKKYKVSKQFYKDFSIEEKNVISETEKFVTLSSGTKEAKDTKDYYVYCNTPEEANKYAKKLSWLKSKGKKKLLLLPMKELSN